MSDPTPTTGLLEQPELRPGPGTLLGPHGIVGLVRRLDTPPWRGWLLGPTLAVHETGDEPLVFTVSRRLSLLPRWDVHEAEGELVGIVGGRWAVDRWEQPVLRLEPDGTFRSAQRRVLGSWDGTRLRFTPEVIDEPLARMLMLALVLV
jgi:hypothetical protein